MNTLINQFLPLTAALSLALTSALQAQTAPPPPVAEFTAQKVGDTGKWSLQFDTIPGYGYTVEESQDLATWSALPGGWFYGNGVHQKCYVCDGPMPNLSTGGGASAPPTPPTWQWRNLMLNLEIQSAGASSVFRVSRAGYTPLVPRLRWTVGTPW